MLYDLAIIGGGPAGLMAAAQASELGVKVILIEKNKRPGVKLLITGGGRCNFTNNFCDRKELANLYYPNKLFLVSAFSRFGVKETIDYFQNAGLKTKIEDNGRVFPANDKGLDLLNILTRKIDLQGGEIWTGREVKKIKSENNTITKLTLENGQEIFAKNFLLTTGGKSYPGTGSNGDAYLWLEEMGHKLIPPRPALTQIHVKDNADISALEGLSLSDVVLYLYSKTKLISSSPGDIIFTGRGLSGPAALNLSQHLDFSKSKTYDLYIDCFPEKNQQELAEYIQKKLHCGNKLFKNILEEIVSPKFAPFIIRELKIKDGLQANSLNKNEKNNLCLLLKKFNLTINGVGSFDQAMITAGGIDLKEIDPKTMKSKIITNLYFAGEIIDLCGPTGGFNLQLCWSTGYVAGNSLVDKNILL